VQSLQGKATDLPGKTRMKHPASPPTTAIASPMFGMKRARAKDPKNHVNVIENRRNLSFLEK